MAYKHRPFADIWDRDSCNNKNALSECGSDPKRTCYVGDNLARDIVGAKAAGLGMTIGVQYPGKKSQTVTEENRPDLFISHFAQLLDIFPPLK